MKSETVEWDDGDGGVIIAVNLALEVHDLSEAEPFVAEVVEAFLMQRMLSPPTTSGLLITLIGKMQPDESLCAILWSLATEGNDGINLFMSQMIVADVVGAIREKDPNESFGVSLLPQQAI